MRNLYFLLSVTVTVMVLSGHVHRQQVGIQTQDRTYDYIHGCVGFGRDNCIPELAMSFHVPKIPHRPIPLYVNWYTNTRFNYKQPT